MKTKEQEQFWKDHPKACIYCNGWGMLISNGTSVPYGSISVNLPDEAILCTYCIEEKCPHCGENLELKDDKEYCKCGWNEDSEGEPIIEPNYDYDDCDDLDNIPYFEMEGYKDPEYLGSD